MNESKRSSAQMSLSLIVFGVGIVFGFFGSFASFLSWVAAVLMGSVFGHLHKYHRCRYFLLKTSLGISIGGIPMWMILGVPFPSNKWWLGILCSFATGTLFFGSAMLTNFYFFCRNFKLTKNDDGQPPSNNGIFRRFLQSFKQKNSDNDQFLQSAITPIA